MTNKEYLTEKIKNSVELMTEIAFVEAFKNSSKTFSVEEMGEFLYDNGMLMNDFEIKKLLEKSGLVYDTGELTEGGLDSQLLIEIRETGYCKGLNKVTDTCSYRFTAEGFVKIASELLEGREILDS